MLCQGLNSVSGKGHYIMFLGNTQLSQCLSLHRGIKMRLANYWRILTKMLGGGGGGHIT